MHKKSIDNAPVGALTSKPYALQARPWELRRAERLDFLLCLFSSAARRPTGSKAIQQQQGVENRGRSPIIQRLREAQGALLLSVMSSTRTLRQRRSTVFGI